MIAYFNGQFLPKKDVALSPDDRGFLFADGLYEVIRCYRGRPFEIESHLARLARGAAHLHFKPDGYEDLDAVCRRLLAENGLGESDALIYIQVTRGAPYPRLHYFPPEDTPLTVYAAVQAFQPDPEKAQNGMGVVLVPDQRWARCDLKTVGLTANVLASQQAFEAGAGEALFVRDGCLMEGAKSSFLIVSGGTVIAPPLTNYILPSVSRQVVEALCEENAIPFAAEPIYLETLDQADELMLAGTTLEVTPVVSVHGRDRTWPVGARTRQLQQAFQRRTETL
jgi:D-alanine transaminase